MEKVSTENTAMQTEKRIYTVEEIPSKLAVSIGCQKRASTLGLKDRRATTNDEENYVGS